MKTIIKAVFIILIIQLINSGPLLAQEFVERYISNIAYSPNFVKDHNIFVCVWGSGLYQSKDQGNTWQKIDIPIHEWDSEKYFQGLALSPNFADDSTIFVGAQKVYRSNDGGEKWVVLSHWSGAPITDIAISPNFQNDLTIFASTFGGSLFRNTLRGDGSWQQLNTPHFMQWSVALSPDYAHDSTLFIGTAGGGIKRSKDRGETWETVTDDLPFESLLVESIEIQKEEGIIYAATYDGVIQSFNSGDTWSVLNDGLTSPVCRDVSLSPNFSTDQTIFLGTADGVFKSANRGASWFLSNSKITTPYIYTIAVSPAYSTDHSLLAGTAEGLFKSTNAGLSWLSVNDGLEVETVPNITKSPFIFDALPSCAIGSNNILHVVWSGLYANVNAPDGVVADVFYMKKENGVWSQPLLISVPNGYYSRDVTIAVDQEGHPHVVFRRSVDQINIKHDDDIYYTCNKGTGFIEPVIVVDGTGMNHSKSSPSDPSVAIDHAGIAHISYTTSLGKTFYINNRNGNFDAPVEIMNGDYDYPSTDLAVDHNGTVHFAIGASFNWPIRDVYYVNNLGGNFSAPLKVSEDDENTRPAIALDSKDNVHILYYYNVRGAKRLGYVTNMTGSFSRPAYIMGYHHPSLCIDFKDKIHIAAQSVDFSPYDVINQIAYANNMNGEFIDREITDLIRGVATAGKRYIAVGPDDSVHIVYANGSMGSYDLYYLCFSPNSSMFHPPVADFAATPTRGSKWLNVHFKNLSTGYIASQKWYFGDGDVSWDANPVHSFYSDTLRTFTVALVVKGVTSDSIAKVDYITVTGTNHSPVLSNATVTPESGDTDTDFVYKVTYSDFDSDPPKKARLLITDHWFDMIRITNDYLNGALFQYSTTLSEGVHCYRFQFVDSTGNHDVYLPASGVLSGPIIISTNISEKEADLLPEEYNLSQNFPNPFNLSTMISYQIPEPSRIELRIFNISGQLVHVLDNAKKPAGYYSVAWDGKDHSGRFLKSGIYFCKMDASNFNKVIKLLIVK